MKVRAAQAGVTLKDLVTRYVEAGLREGTPSPADDMASPRQRSALPVIAKATTGVPIPALSTVELERIDLEEDLAKHGRSVRC